MTATNGSGSGQSTSAATAVVTTPGETGPQAPFTKITIDPNPVGSMIEKAFADIDGDGRLDAVIGMQESPTQGGVGGIFWYQFPSSGNPSDAWTKRTILPSGTAYEDMAPFDVDRDGRVDIVASVDTRVYWYRNAGTGSGPWQQNLIGTGRGENNIVIGDVDGDGKADVVTNSIIYFQESPASWTPKVYNDTYNAVALLDIGSGQRSDQHRRQRAEAALPDRLVREPPRARRQRQYRYVDDALRGGGLRAVPAAPPSARRWPRW